MKPVGELLLVSDRVLHDSLTDLISVVHCLEVVAAPSFPARHPHFAIFARYRLDEPAPDTDVAVDFRLVRVSPTDGERVIADFPGVWAAGTTRARIATNFQYVSLERAERLLFRVDHRIGDGPWQPGPSCALDVVLADIAQPASPPAEPSRP